MQFCSSLSPDIAEKLREIKGSIENLEKELGFLVLQEYHGNLEKLARDTNILNSARRVNMFINWLMICLKNFPEYIDGIKSEVKWIDSQLILLVSLVKRRNEDFSDDISAIKATSYFKAGANDVISSSFS